MHRLIDGYRPKIIIVESFNEDNSKIHTLLKEKGYDVLRMNDYNSTMEEIKSHNPDLVLLDISSVYEIGLKLCSRIKNNKLTKDIPVVFITTSQDEELILQGFDAGAVDFLTKPFNSKELIARIKTHIDLKITKEMLFKKIDEITEINNKLLESKENYERYYRILSKEISSAAEYVQSLLPNKISTKDLRTNWLFVPSQSLGGDSFGYHWLDENNFIIYLLDVSGHGVASALQSVSVLNMLRFRTLPVKDFTDPAAVFSELNKAYPIQKHNYLFFTLFYAVWNKATRKLRFAGAGHPPSFLITKDKQLLELNSQNILIGTKDNAKFTYEEIEVPHNSNLLIYSDGIIDPHTFDLNIWNEEKLRNYFISNYLNSNNFEEMLTYLYSLSRDGFLKDDISLLHIFLK
ncbi:MAG: SpoIIE family protein phosphatase [Candidatus Kapaibacteriota bacterium]